MAQPAAAERVLIVDDEPVMRDVLSRFLRRAGFEVVEVGSVVTALDELIMAARRNQVYDHAVVDLVLKDGDGEDVVRACESLSPRPNIVVLSGNIDSRRALDLSGRCLYLPKPVGSKTLLEALRRRRDPISDFVEAHGLTPRERDVLDREVVTATLTAHAEAVARRLRHDGFQGRTVTLKVKLGKARGFRSSRTDPSVREPVYPALTRAQTLKGATSDGRRIRDVAVSLWDAAKIGEPVRLLGVSVSNLQGGAMEQLDLFGARISEDRLGPALDAITARFGKGAIRRAVDEPEKATASDRRKRGE